MVEDMINASIRDLRKDLSDFKETLGKQQGLILSELAVVKDRSHQPSSCLLGKEVKSLQLAEAKQAGALVVVGFIASSITAVIIGFVIALSRKVLGTG